MRVLLIVGSALAGVLLFLLATASAADTTLLARHFPLLLGLNAALAGALAAMVGYQVVGILRRYRARAFGSRLTLRFLLLFALMAVAPGVLVYTVSVQFLTRSIESWFDVKVDAALEGGINLGQSVIDRMMIEMQTKARVTALELAERSPTQQVSMLNRLREQAGVQEIVLLGAGGALLASATEDVTRFVPELPTANMLRQARSAQGYSSVDAADGRPLALRVVVPVTGLAIADEARFVQLRQSVPSGLARSAQAVEEAYRDYRELALSRQGLRRIYIVTLTLALLMALFVAVSLAAILSARLSAPLANLAQATQAVARGDFSQRPPVTSRDELGVLTESFNSMTRQLDEARKVVESNRVALETAKSSLENILANLSAGVLVFDRDLRLTISNRGAAQILTGELSAFLGRPLQDWSGPLESFAASVREQFLQHGEHTWQLELALKGTGKTLLARGAALPGATGGGHVLVFDDITQLIQAQRATAWAEVARRLAHEIKNPLTPIQLSAERLEMKLGDRLAPEDAAILRRATQTIVNQVTALKSMVDDFGDYARLPAPVPTGLDLNALIADVLTLYETSRVPIGRRLAPSLPPVWADGAQIRQVIHNLVQNAQDALDQRKESGRQPAIEVCTELVGDKVRLLVSDNGDGFPEELMARIFEPYVTTKPRGTGLGLAIVKKIVDEHHGSIAIENLPQRGASVSVLLPRTAQAA
ncbi:MAG: ATP-binding protein [Betaproteobacteria bacterium]|nr:ATP-binding protein [Betaproteobacteria bacterium]MDH5222016.1 ATP-binding protein [Betaproteobacteria bacterium]MDH5349448.1 ATP-binding protein [Betaproteobacteria bacterium]